MNVLNLSLFGRFTLMGHQPAISFILVAACMRQSSGLSIYCWTSAYTPVPKELRNELLLCQEDISRTHALPPRMAGTQNE